MTWLFIRKFGPYLALLALAFVILFQRNTITSRTADRDKAVARAADVTEANKSLKDALDIVKQQRVDNDAIAEAVAKRIGKSETRLVEYRTTIERVKSNDPVVRAWGAVPVPPVVREALRAGEDAPAPR